MMRSAFAAFALVWFVGAAQAEARHGISAFGELKYRSDFKHFDYVNPDAPKGGIEFFWRRLVAQS